MRIKPHDLKNIIDFTQSQMRSIILEVENIPIYEREPLRKKYKSYLFLLKYLNHLHTRKINIYKNQLHHNIKREMINYNSNEPFYKVLQKIQEIN